MSVKDPSSACDSARAADMCAVEMWGRVIKGFHATNQALHDDIRSTFDLNETETETILTLIRENDHRAHMSTLAKATAFSTGGFTKVADRLASRGLAERAACDTDRRVTYLVLTNEGVTLAHDLVEFVANANRTRFINVVGPEHATLVADAMTQLYRANSRE